MSDQWTDLRELWQESEAAASADDAARELVRRAERNQMIGRVTRGGVALFAIGTLVAAVAHAASAIEAALALSVGVTIGVVWVLSAFADRRQRDLLSQPALLYLDARLELLHAQLRRYRFIVVVLALELVFFAPWWKEGIPIHFGTASAFAAMSLFWLPLGAIAVFVTWTLRRARVVQRELRTLLAVKARNEIDSTPN